MRCNSLSLSATSALLALAACTDAQPSASDAGSPSDAAVTVDAAAAEAWPFPATPRGSRLGIHGIWSTNAQNQGPMDFIPTTPFPVVKAVDDLWWLVETKETWPETITIGRIVGPWDGVQGVADAADDQLHTYADPPLEAIRERLEEHPEYRDAIDYWEIVNEPDPAGAEGYRKLAVVMKLAMDQADAEGIKLALFSLNAGTPEWEEMVAMVETGVFEQAREGGHILALHEGVLPFADPIDTCWSDEPTTIPGSPPIPRAGCLTFRYRFLYSLLEERDAVIPLVVSEFYSGPGYAHEGVTPQEVRERIAWYDEEASRDYWLLGFLPFTLGPSPGWEVQDYGWAYPELIDYMGSVSDRENARPPE